MNKTRLLLFPTFAISSMITAQTASVTVSGKVTNTDKAALPYASIILKKEKDTAFVAGTITNEEGRFSITGIKPDHYLMETSISGYNKQVLPVFIGSLSEFLEIPIIELERKKEQETKIEEVVLSGTKK